MLHYKISGSGKNHIVLLHGFLESSEVWYKMLPELEKYFSVIRIDLPGHGKSAVISEIQTMDLMADEVKKTLQKIGVSKFHILGHSMGGYVALAYANKYPENLDSITLFFSSYFADSEDKKSQRIKSINIINEEFDKYVTVGTSNLFNFYELENHKYDLDFAKKIALKTPKDGALASVRGMIERKDKKELLENFNGKIIVICGREDNAVNSMEIIENLPKKSNIKAYILNCGHNGHWERPNICTEIIRTELLQ